jgi:hypothetical protein
MDFSNSKDEGLLALYESVRRQVLVNRASGAGHRFLGDNVRVYAERLFIEMDSRQLSYVPIIWN